MGQFSDLFTDRQLVALTETTIAQVEAVLVKLKAEVETKAIRGGAV